MAVYIGKDQPTGWVVMHYGVKGMRWRHRKGQISGNNADRVRELLEKRRANAGEGRDRDREQVEYFKRAWEETERGNRARNPDYKDPVRERPHRGEYHAELGEDGHYNRYTKELRGRDGSRSYGVSKRAESNADRAYDELRKRRQTSKRK